MKYMRKNKKQWVLTGITGASIILSFAGVTHAQNQLGQDQPLLGPLQPNDPAAKLDPRLLNVPPMSMPEEGSSTTTRSSQSPNREIRYDIRTGSTQVGAIGTQTRSRSTSFSPPNLGADANIQPESRSLGVPPGSFGLQPRSVIGTDDRTLIANTTAYPWRTITKLYITFPNGNQGSCSGALISTKYVLTAGHCIYNESSGGWATDVEVIPGLNGTYKPYGSAFATNLRSYTGWTSYEDSNYDFALVTLDRNMGDTTGWLGYSYYRSINGVTANSGGYPGDRGSGTRLYYHYGSVTRTTAQRVNYPIDTAGGQSGSAVYRVNNSDRYVFAVHTTAGNSFNSGTRIDSQKYDDLNAWIDSGD